WCPKKCGSFPTFTQPAHVIVGMFIRPEFLTGSPKSQQRIIVDCPLCDFRTPAPIPRAESCEPVFRQILRIRRNLPSLSLRMIRVAVAIQTTASRRRFEEHSVASRVWRTIGDAMLHHVYIEARPQWPHKPEFFRRPCEFHDLFNQKIWTLRVPLVKHDGRDPNLVGHLDRSLGSGRL